MINFNSPLVLFALLLPVSLLFILKSKWKKYLIRIISVCLIILALSGPKLGTTDSKKDVFFMVDRSPSVDLTENKTEILGKMKNIVDANKERRFGIITFSETARVALPLEDKFSKLKDLGEGFSGDSTDLSSGVDLALTYLSDRKGGQLVLLSDGRINSHLGRAISLARDQNVPISTLPIGKHPDGDLLLESFDMPEEIEPKRPFKLKIKIFSPIDQTAYLSIYREKNLVGNWKTELEKGFNVYQLEDRVNEGGVVSYKAVVRGAEDKIPQNNSRSAKIRVNKSSDILIICREAKSITEILEKIDKTYDISDEIPPLTQLFSYKTVILTGMGFSDIPNSSLLTLERYVKETGGGLLVIQGKKELEDIPQKSLQDILPVTYKTPEIREEPQLAVIYLLDTSASMQGGAAGASKIELLRETAAASIDILDDNDLVGLISFDREFRWNIELKRLGKGEKVYQSLRELTAAGGTDMYYPLKEAISRLNSTSGRIKHIILITDGKTLTKDRDFPGLTARLNRNNDITLSSIATGPSPNRDILEKLTKAGGGNFYRAWNYSDLPRISMEITRRINRNRFLTGSFKVNGSLSEENLGSIPPVEGYVLTYPKKEANTLLNVQGDPLLSSWQLGLGKVAVLNTDLRGNWSKEWMNWPYMGLFLDKLVDMVRPISLPSRYLLRPTIQKKEDKILLKVEARKPDGDFANLLDVIYRDPNSEEQYPVPQSSPGIYKALIEPDKELIEIMDKTRNLEVQIPISSSYPEEYFELGVDSKTLERIANETNGKFLEDELLPPADTETESSARKIHIELLLTGLSLFFVDLVKRKFE